MSDQKSGSAAKAERKAARLAEQLRANLQKRKAQTRARRLGDADQRPEGIPPQQSRPNDNAGRHGSGRDFRFLNRCAYRLERRTIVETISDRTFRGNNNMDRIRIVGGNELTRHHTDLRRQERGAAADDRLAADRRDADAGKRAASGRRRAADPHPRQSRRRLFGQRPPRERRTAPMRAPSTSPPARSSTPPRPTSWSPRCARASG